MQIYKTTAFNGVKTGFIENLQVLYTHCINFSTLGMLFFMKLFQIFIKKRHFIPKKALYKKSTFGKTIFLSKKKAFLQKVVFLEKCPKIEKNIILLVFISSN